MRFTLLALAALFACSCNAGTDPTGGGTSEGGNHEGANNQGGNGQGADAGSTSTFEAGGSGGFVGCALS